jgi:basic membrane protein A and related proteins
MRYVQITKRTKGPGSRASRCRRRAGVAGALIVLAVVAAGCGSSSKKEASPIKVAVITDIGGLNDKGFNALAYKGLKEAESQYGIDGRVLISKSAADYVPNLSTAARQGYDLVIAVGFLMGDPTASVATQFPDTKFAIVDVSAPGLKGKPTNVRGIMFAEQEAGCLAGVAAATESTTGTISSVGGLKIPPVDAYIAGYQYCAKQVKPDIKTLNGYSQDFVAQDKCKEVALNQIGQGSDVVFQVAGQCGLGAITAAGDSKVWGIGVDSDQSFLGPQVLTSALKKVDVGVSETIGLVVDGTFKGGVDGLFNTANDGVGYGKVAQAAPNRTALIDTLNSWEKKLADGDVTPPRTLAG